MGKTNGKVVCSCMFVLLFNPPSSTPLPPPPLQAVLALVAFFTTNWEKESQKVNRVLFHTTAMSHICLIKGLARDHFSALISYEWSLSELVLIQ